MAQCQAKWRHLGDLAEIKAFCALWPTRDKIIIIRRTVNKLIAKQGFKIKGMALMIDLKPTLKVVDIHNNREIKSLHHFKRRTSRLSNLKSMVLNILAKIIRFS